MHVQMHILALLHMRLHRGARDGLLGMMHFLGA